VWEGEIEDYDGREITHDEYFSRCCFDVSLCYLLPLRTYGLGIRLGRYAKIGDNIGTHWQATICFSRKTTLYNSNTGGVR
jgi:hypothetical protein